MTKKETDFQTGNTNRPVPDGALPNNRSTESEAMPNEPDGPRHDGANITAPPVTGGEPMSDLEKELIKEAALLEMSATEIEAIRDKAKKRATAKQKEAVEKRLEDMYYHQEMAKVDPDEELVEYTPAFPSSNLIHNRVPICGALFNNKSFENGKSYRIPISQYRDLAYVSFMAQKNERGLNLRDRDGIPPLNIQLPRQL